MESVYIGHKDSIKALELSDDDNLLFSAGSEGNVMLWNTQNYEC